MYYIDRPVEKGIILRRELTPNGPVVETNVPHNIKYHSQSFEWGYAVLDGCQGVNRTRMQR